MPGVYTSGHYDTNEWEPVDMVTVAHNESISLVRGIGVEFGQIFGGKSTLLEKKILDLQQYYFFLLHILHFIMILNYYFKFEYYNLIII